MTPKELNKLINETEICAHRHNAEDTKLRSFNALKKYIESEWAFWEEIYPVVEDNDRQRMLTFHIHELHRWVVLLAEKWESWGSSDVGQLLDHIKKNLMEYRLTSDRPGSQYLKGLVESGEISKIAEVLDVFVHPNEDAPPIKGATLPYIIEFALRDKLGVELNKDVDAYISSRKEFAQLKEQYTSILQENKQNMDRLIDTYEQKMDGITAAYSEKLIIVAPVKGWTDFAEVTKGTSKKWKWATIAVVLLLGVTGGVILWKLPQRLFDSADTTPVSAIIRWFSVFGLIISSQVYLLRLFVRLWMSSEHLTKDARERARLAHQYLALIKEGAITTEERSIVLQSLFSRAETGLLKGDSSPTMPNSIIELLSKFGGS